MPRYMVWISETQYYLCDSLEKALECKQAFGGNIYEYEPLGTRTAEEITKTRKLDKKEETT